MFTIQQQVPELKAPTDVAKALAAVTSQMQEISGLTTECMVKGHSLALAAAFIFDAPKNIFKAQLKEIALETFDKALDFAFAAKAEHEARQKAEAETEATGE